MSKWQRLNSFKDKIRVKIWQNVTKTNVSINNFETVKLIRFQWNLAKVQKPKGSDRQCMVVELTCSIIENFFRIHLRPIRRFYGAYLFSKSANAIFKILIDCPFWRDDFENRFFFNYSMTTRKNVTKILQ